MGGGGSWNIQPAGEDLVGTSNQEARRRGGEEELAYMLTWVKTYS
jgi:hypothetical protein